MNGTRPTPLGLEAMVERAIEELIGSWVSTAQADRVAAILRSFVGFCVRGYGVATLGAVTPEVAAAFVCAPMAGSAQPPTVSLMHLRRLGTRLLFRAARQVDAGLGDPTLDLVLPPRSQLATRPLTDDEVTLCRAAASWSLNDGRRAAAWGLAEATCRSLELAQTRVRDLDLPGGRVWIHGGKTTSERWGELSEWGRLQLERRVATLSTDPDTLVVYAGQGQAETGQVSGCIAVRDVLIRAGLGTEPGVRPASVAGWAGATLLTEGAPIDEVARRLGMAGLDRTAKFIGWDWKSSAS